MGKKKAAGCKCIDEADKQLREKVGATFKQCLTMDFDTMSPGFAGPFLAIEWAGGAKRNGKSLPTVTCAYCPFCGKKKP
jgi:hypothetical protein